MYALASSGFAAEMWEDLRVGDLIISAAGPCLNKTLHLASVSVEPFVWPPYRLPVMYAICSSPSLCVCARPQCVCYTPPLVSVFPDVWRCQWLTQLLHHNAIESFSAVCEGLFYEDGSQPRSAHTLRYVYKPEWASLSFERFCDACCVLCWMWCLCEFFMSSGVCVHVINILLWLGVLCPRVYLRVSV